MSWIINSRTLDKNYINWRCFYTSFLEIPKIHLYTTTINDINEKIRNAGQVANEHHFWDVPAKYIQLESKYEAMSHKPKLQQAGTSTSCSPRKVSSQKIMGKCQMDTGSRPKGLLWPNLRQFTHWNKDSNIIFLE